MMHLLKRFLHELKFLPTAERIVEAEHSTMKKALGLRTPSGPYVSTALRMPEMQQVFTRPTDYKRLLEQWPLVSNPDDAAKRFGLWRHPQYQEAVSDKRSRHERRSVLSVLLYMLDPETQFRNVKAMRKRRLAHERKKKIAKDKFFENLNPDLNAWSPATVERKAAAQHMQDRMEPGHLYSLPVGVAALPSLQSRLHAQAQIKLADQRLENDAADSLSLNEGAMSSAPEVGAGMDPVAEGQVVLRPASSADDRRVLFFRLSRNAPARARVLNLPPASGMKLQSTDLSVTLHSSVQSADACWVEVEARKAQGIASAASILSLCNADAGTIPSVLQQWSTCPKLVYKLKNFPAIPDLASLLLRFVLQRAFPGIGPAQHLAVNPSDKDFVLCQTLEKSGYIACTSQEPSSAWVFTERGLNDLVHTHEVCRPCPVFPAIQDLLGKIEEGFQAVESWSSWELMKVLQHQGRRLKPLPPGKQRRRALPPHTFSATSFTWYCGTRKSISLESPATRQYMQCLVLSQQLFQAGVSHIYHGQREMYYKQLLDPDCMVTGELADEEVPALQPEAEQLQLPDEEFCVDHVENSNFPIEPNLGDLEPPQPVPPVPHVPHRDFQDEDLQSVASLGVEDVLDVSMEWLFGPDEPEPLSEVVRDPSAAAVPVPARGLAEPAAHAPDTQGDRDSSGEVDSKDDAMGPGQDEVSAAPVSAEPSSSSKPSATAERLRAPETHPDSLSWVVLD